MVSTVNSWSQTTGTVTFETTFAGGFETFNVTGNATVSGGSWTHLSNTTSEASRLRVDVGGDFSLASGATITGKELGYNTFTGPGGAVGGGYEEGGSYGGIGGGSAELPYGSVETPTSIGSGGTTSKGGGAVYLTVGGATDIDGTVNVDSGDNGNSGHGSGGSIYIETASITGDGTLSASCGLAGWGGRGRGGGGRIAVQLTGSGEDFSSFLSTATVEAITRNLSGAKGGAGTVYLADETGAAQLIVDNGGVDGQFTSAGTTAFTYSPTVNVTTRNGGKLMIEDDDTIDFSTADLNTNWVIRIAGDAGVTIPTTWTITDAHLMPDALSAVPGNLIVGSGGLITPHATTEALNLNVVDDLTIEAGGAIHADSYGYYMSGPGYTLTGERDGGSHGGQGGNADSTDSQGPCYGLFLAPVDFGSGSVNGTGLYGGGAIGIVVGGTLAVNGTGVISANGMGYNESSGSGGSVYIQADALTGDGTIRADGGPHDSYGAGGGGGRVAVLLTGSGDFSSFGGSLQAYADSYSSQNGAGGTVYRETAADGAGDGGVYVDFGNVATAMHVELPPTYGAFTEDLSGVTFYLRQGGKVGLYGDVAIGGLDMAAGSVLYGNGYQLTLNSLADAGTIDLDNGGVTLALNGNATLASATLSGTGTLTKAGTGILTLGANYGTNLIVDEGTLRIASGTTITGNTTVNGGRLEIDNGAIDGTLTVAGGTLAIGSSPGQATVVDLDIQAGGTFEVDLAGLAAGSGYDQVIVTGSTTLAGALNLILAPGFEPGLEDSFTIIDGSNPIVTAFSDGDFVRAGGFKFAIDYAGGVDGFDVVLMRVPEPASLGLMALGIAMLARRRRNKGEGEFANNGEPQ